MDIRAMRYFVAIVDQGSLTRAAEVVCVAQPALSQQLAALEAEFGVALLHRSAKGVRPTEAGRTLYRHARAIIKQVEAAGAEVRVAGADVTGAVAIGLPTTAAAAFGMPLMRAVRERYPRVRLQLFESMSGYISELLNNGRLDFAILFRDTPSRAVEPEPLASESLYLIGTPPAGSLRPPRRARRGSLHGAGGAGAAHDADDGLDTAGEGTVALRQLDGLPLVLPSGAQGLRDVVERSFARAGIRLEVVADLDSLPFLLASAREGLACTILPASSVADAAPAVPRRLIVPELRRTLSLCWPRALPRTHAAEAVAEILRELVAARIAEGGSLKRPPAPAEAAPATAAQADK
ncbi:LysR substrate-binding domain-containing protein [Cupriavidus malaysiensis]|uniref:LysR family transcriptional regulator n=1 Tax=Cupriavidus malaysiensis TaxID=367825 RepID=A0ABN4TU32_9BURK|nr:LysR substrate-binding domain-containing protein [Cupriavidus malaysiensis]AOZ10394.1 LysR family transcriptional regulator [Cupriavidus malaysiensis]